MIRNALLCLFFVITATLPVMGQVNVGTNGTLNGRVYADYYWIASNHDSELEGNNGFWFRRIYLTYNQQISDSFSGRLRLEMSSAGDFFTNAKLEPVVKDAYLKWSNEDHAIYAGISSTPTFGLTEDIWGYRSVEKSPQDLYDYGSSRDFGLAFKGNIGAEDKLNYHFMVGNGNSNGSELNKGKKIMLALSYNLTEHVVVEGYGDWNDKKGDTDTYTAQGLLGYQSDGFNIGALYSYQVRKNATAVGDLELDLAAVFTNARISDNTKIFARVDHLFDPNPTGPGNDYLPISNRAESTFMTTGVDVILEQKIHLIPNVETIVYGEDAAGLRPNTDIIPRMTLYYSF